MDRLLAKLERRFGRWAIPNLAAYLVALNAFVFVLAMARPAFIQALMFDPERVRRGEVWRVITFVFIPPSLSPIWIIFALYFAWLCGMALESVWGTFKFNLFYLLGMLGTMAAAFILGQSMSNLYLNTSIFLAFATLFPNFELLIFFILPVKAKWLGFLTCLLLAMSFGDGTNADRVAIAVALANYVLFCHRVLYNHLRQGFTRTRRESRMQKFRAPPREYRTCKICGKSDADPQVDMRVCTCAKCGEPTSYCLEHARNH